MASVVKLWIKEQPPGQGRESTGMPMRHLNEEQDASMRNALIFWKSKTQKAHTGTTSFQEQETHQPSHPK